MRHQSFQTPTDRREWLKLETTIGTNQEIIDEDVQAFIAFVRQMDPLEQQDLERISSIKFANIEDFNITDQQSLQLVMLRKFMSQIGLPLMIEAVGYEGQSETNLYLNLAEKLLTKGEYPEKIFAYATYRRRGTPNTWLQIDDQYTRKQLKEAVSTSVPKIINRLNYLLKHTRRQVLVSEVNDLVIYLLSKPRAAKVYHGERRNVEVQTASYTLIVIDLVKKRVGAVTKSIREVQAIQSYILHKTFPGHIAPPRNDVTEDGIKLLRKILKPDEQDLLLLQSLEMRKTSLKNNPSIKLKVNGTDTIEEAIEEVDTFWAGSSIADLKQIEFGIPAGRAGSYRKVGLYTYGDEWRRTFFNTSHRNITILLENQFLDHVSKRLGYDIKTSRFILEEIDARFILDKFLRSKQIITDPAIPEAAEKMLFELTTQKLIARQDNSVLRMCADCYTRTWDQEVCPNPRCGRDNMRIISEAVRIRINEAQVMRQLAANAKLQSAYEIRYYPRKQRGGHPKSIVGFFNPEKKITTFAILIASKQDAEYAEKLSQEGFGVLAIIDPKVENRTSDLESSGCTVLSLIDVFLLLTDNSQSLDVATAITDQERGMLKRLHSNAQISLRRITLKNNYDEAKFEIDIKNILNILVPDVVRLGTEYTGTSVPDGYLRYGTKGNRQPGRAKRLFGWDAKYSRTATYSLDTNDVKKQKSYIRWLSDKKKEASRFGRLGVYGIIANFDEPSRMNTALTNLSAYNRLNSTTRIVLIDDKLLIKVGEWLLDHWQTVLDNNSLVSDEFFAWIRRKPPKNASYTTSSVKDWSKLENRLNKVIRNLPSSQ
jgi:hypothetical protein